jgi:hypothetical protein
MVANWFQFSNLGPVLIPALAGGRRGEQSGQALAREGPVIRPQASQAAPCSMLARHGDGTTR